MATTVHEMLKREKPASAFIPYSIHASDFNVKTANGDMVSVIKLDGAAHEAADVEDVEAWHEALHGTLRAASDEDVAIWRHTIRRENNSYPEGEFHGHFAKHLNDKYRAHFEQKSMMQNDLYLTFVLKGSKPSAKIFGKKAEIERAAVIAEIADRSKRLDSIVDSALATLGRYNPKRLGCYVENGIKFSQSLEFLSFLLNGVWRKSPVPSTRISNSLAHGRIFFGVESGEVRTIERQRFFAMVSATDYPEVTDAGELTSLLILPFEFVLTQSFAFMNNMVAKDLVLSQQRKLLNAKDASLSQIEGLGLLLDDLTANRCGMGEHHFSVLVWGDTQDELVRRVAAVGMNLAECGFSGVVREDLALEAAFFSQLPGTFSLRPRPAPITTRNFAGLAALHNFPVGQPHGNQWGPAVSVLRTTAGSPFYFNFHLPRSRKVDLSDADDGEDRVAGHTLVVGPTGSGKTVYQGFLLSQAEKYEPTVFVFDKDRGQEVLIRGLGGQYNVLELGVHTGWNPFHLSPTAANIDFLTALMKFCCDAQSLINEQVRNIHEAVMAVLSMDPDRRRISSMLDFLDPTEDDGPYSRLKKWCGDGANAWVFDNEEDSLSLTGARHFGFDVTHFLADDELRTAIIMYLYHRMEALIGTRRFIMLMDEFWRMIRDPYLAAKAEDAVRTWRKRDAIAIFGTQSPREVIESPIGPALLDNIPTLVLLPAPKARQEDYVDGLKCSQREFEIIKKDMPEQNLRGFLLKQANLSTVCVLNLAGFNDELAVLSSTSTTAPLSVKAIQRAGSSDPSVWLPVFQQLRRGH